MQVLHSLSLSLSLVLALLVVISTPIQASLLDSLAPYSTILLSPLSWLEYMTTVSVAAPHQPVDPDHRTVTHSHQQSQPYIWPLPHTYTEGSDRTYIAPPRRGHSFVKYIVKDASDVPTPLSGLDCHVRDRVQGMLSRYGTIQQPLQVHSSYQTVDSVTLSTLDLNEGMIVGLDVRVVDQHAKLTHGVNESYSLHIPAPTKSHAETATILKVTVDAQTIYGVIHALETLSQLVRYDYDRELYYFDHTPLTVIDKPRFPYRGLLIDTSRHFLPLPTMFEILVSMMINKLNVLHWHIVDSQAFPFRSTTHPNITQYGRYTIREQYTYTDIEQIVQFANQVGIRVVFELDVPGHAASWCAGEPQLCPSTTCLEPLDISQTYTFKVIEDLLRELTALSNDTYVHLGADEVDTHCWSDTPRLADWFKTHNMSMLDGYAYSLDQTTEIASRLNRKPIYWEEAYTSLKTRLPKDATVMSWISKTPTVKQAADDGYNVIMSDTDFYLDHLDVPWQKFYLNDPLSDYPSDEVLLNPDSKYYSAELQSSAERVLGGNNIN